MSYYDQNYYRGSNQAAAAPSSGLQFLPTQFDSSQNTPPARGMMNNQSSSYTYGDGSREPLSMGILAAFSTQGYPDEPPLLEG